METSQGLTQSERAKDSVKETPGTVISISNVESRPVTWEFSAGALLAELAHTRSLDKDQAKELEILHRTKVQDGSVKECVLQVGTSKLCSSIKCRNCFVVPHLHG